MRLTALLLMSVFLSGCNAKQEDRSEMQTQENDYPDLALKLRDGGDLSTKTLKGNNIFFFFQPDCRHCQIEAINIEQRLSEFSEYHLYFISSADMGAIDAFAESFGLDGKKNVTFAWASTESVLGHYGPIRTPSVYIYSDGKLKRSFDGQTEIENLIEAL